MNIWPWRLELKKETRQAAISLWHQLELTPNYLISYLENTGSRSTRYVSMPHPNESSILPKFLEKSDPEVGRPVSQHDRCKRLNQRHLRYACRFKSTNQRIATVGSSKSKTNCSHQIQITHIKYKILTSDTNCSHQIQITHLLYVNGFLSIWRFTKVGHSSEAARLIHRRKTAVNSLQLLQSPPNSA